MESKKKFKIDGRKPRSMKAATKRSKWKAGKKMRES